LGKNEKQRLVGSGSSGVAFLPLLAALLFDFGVQLCDGQGEDGVDLLAGGLLEVRGKRGSVLSHYRVIEPCGIRR